jgi:preprotein translocase subunit SecE
MKIPYQNDNTLAFFSKIPYNVVNSNPPTKRVLKTKKYNLNRMANKLIQYIVDSKNELKHVTWPSKKEVKRHTILVIIISVGVALFLGIIDYILNFGLEQII